MLRFIHPFFGDLMFDGVGLLGCGLVLFLMWDAWKDWKRAGAIRKRRKGRLPYSTGSRRPARGFLRKFRGRLALGIIVSGAAVMLVGGGINPHNDKTTPPTRAGTLNPATVRNPPRGNQSPDFDEAILTYQTLPPESRTRGSIANGPSNATTSPFGNNPDATNRTLNHP